MSTGKVKFFNETKGVGFIVDDNTGQEVFVHVTGIKEKIRDGDSVTFETQESKKGISAIDVKLA